MLKLEGLNGPIYVDPQGVDIVQGHDDYPNATSVVVNATRIEVRDPLDEVAVGVALARDAQAESDNWAERILVDVWLAVNNNRKDPASALRAVHKVLAGRIHHVQGRDPGWTLPEDPFGHKGPAQVIYQPHVCQMPSDESLPVGTVVECIDCGQRWMKPLLRIWGLWTRLAANDGEAAASPVEPGTV